MRPALDVESVPNLKDIHCVYCDYTHSKLLVGLSLQHGELCIFVQYEKCRWRYTAWLDSIQQREYVAPLWNESHAMSQSQF